jgi:uncharacterized protein with HEPN domain
VRLPTGEPDEACWPPKVSTALAVANRNFIIHRYDQINRAVTWQTLLVDLPSWQASLAQAFIDAQMALELESG